jgi:Spy/CpxP family protein refolding chaperone
MQAFPRLTRVVVAGFLLLAGGLALGGGTANAVPPGDEKPLLEQLRDLRERLAKLEASVAAHAQPASAPMPAMPAAAGPGMEMAGMMAMMQQMQKMMGMMMGGGGGNGMPGMGAAPAGGATGATPSMGGNMGTAPAKPMAPMEPMKPMQPMEPMESMDASEMGMAPPMAAPATSPMPGMTAAPGTPSVSTLPGFPGASHLYHIGSTGYFLDHPGHLSLTTEQQAALNSIREKAALEKSSFHRKIEEGEQALWSLTASDSPDATAIESKVREIEGHRADQRAAFIRSVGEAAKVLTDEQRKALTGVAMASAPADTKMQMPGK